MPTIKSMDSCVLVVTTYTKKFGLQFGPTETEFSNVVDRYTIAMRKDSSDNFPSGFESSFGSDPTHFVAKYSLHEEPHKELKISQ